MSDTRERIATHVRNHPGVHFSELAAALDLANGQVQYHTRRLLSDDDLVRETVAGRTHFFLPGYDAADREAIALVHRETVRDVVRHLCAGASSPDATAAAVGIARSTLQYHVGNLRAADLVEKEHDGGRVRLTLTDSERAARLLDTVEPSRTDRAVDRFTSLLDDALDG